MSAARGHKPIVHFVGSIPLPDAGTGVFRTSGEATEPHLKRLPDGETGIRKTWIRCLLQVLADNPGIEVASDVPSFNFTQWDGKLLREIPRLRLMLGAQLELGELQNRLCRDGDRGVASVRPPATGRRDPVRRQIPDITANPNRADLYPAHTIIRNFFGSMTRKLSVTSSQ